MSWEAVGIWVEAIALIAIFGLDYQEYKRQGEERKKQEVERKRQAEDREKDNADRIEELRLLRQQSEATKQSLELVMNRDRARVRVGPPLELKVENINPGVMLLELRFPILNVGYGRAFIRDTTIEGEISKNLVPSRSAVLSMASAPTIVEPSIDGIVQRHLLLEHLTTEIVDGLKRGELRIHLFGSVKYGDTVTEGRETHFNYVWNVTDLGERMPPPVRMFASWVRNPISGNSES